MTEATGPAPHGAHHTTPGGSADHHAPASAEIPPLPALRTVQTPLRWRRLAQTLAILIFLAALAVLLLPWQQTAICQGRVVAFRPYDRPQVIDSPISGRVMKWYVLEGSRVQAGDPVFEVQNNDPEWLARLEEQRIAAEGKVAASEAKVAQYLAQVEALTDGRRQNIASAEEKVRAGEQAVAASEQSLTASRATFLQAELNYRRQEDLAQEGIASQLDFEIARRTYETAQADVLAKEASLREKQADLASKRFDVRKIAQEDQAKIESAGAQQEQAEGELAAAQSDLAKATNALAQQQTSLVRAPRTGTIFRLLQAQGTAQVKEGDSVASLVPDTDQPMVELWVEGLDVPLVTVGREVRLQFEGWPAVQLAGWPSMSVGTFGGTVKVVDATDDKGKFRILVEPDPDDMPWPQHEHPQVRSPNTPHAPAPVTRFVSGFQAWFVVPGGTYLRQGVRANGWVLLNKVPLWFEIWRQLNGFPPVVGEEPAKDDLPPTVKDIKKAKPPLPK